MSGKYGVSEINKILVTVVELGNVIEDMIQHKKDGGSTLTMFGKIIDLGEEIFDLFSLDIKLLKEQFNEINSEDMDELRESFKVKFDLDNEEAEQKIEAGIDLLDSLGESIIDVIKFARTFKK